MVKEFFIGNCRIELGVVDANTEIRAMQLINGIAHLYHRLYINTVGGYATAWTADGRSIHFDINLGEQHEPESTAV